MSIRSYPLQWPQGWKKCKHKLAGKFKTNRNSISIADGAKRIFGQLAKMGVDTQSVVISTNLEPRLDGLPKIKAGMETETGVAVYWTVKRTPEPDQARCMAIDIYDNVAQNLGAVAATLEAMRAIERHGPSGDECQNLVPCVIPIQEIGKRQSGTARNGVGYGEDGDPMYTLHSSPMSVMGSNIGIRRLTPVECARLQGFPDDWCSVAGLSDSAQYRAFGNAVAVPVAEWIGRRIVEFA